MTKKYILKVVWICVMLCIAIAFIWYAAYAGGKTKTRYKCFDDGVRVPCPKNYKQSPEFKDYLREKKARRHDTSRQYYTDEDREDNTERTYIESYPRTYYDETVRE